LADLLGKQSSASDSTRGGTSMRSAGIELGNLIEIPAFNIDGVRFLPYAQPLLFGADANSNNDNSDGSRRERRSSRRGGRRGGGQGESGDGGTGRPGGAAGASSGGGQSETQLKPLDWATFSRIFDQVTLTGRLTIDGVINVNTVSFEVLRAFLEDNDDLAGKIINYRESLGGEVANVCDLLSVEGMSQDTLKKYIDQFSVRSSVYLIQVTATSSVSGVSYTTEMVVNRDRQGREVLYKLEGVGN
jgi:hypothetical protein